MIKEINMPMMAPTTDGGSSSESELTWDDIPSAGPCDIQSGRNVYIELNEDQTCTKASAGKILQFIKEGFMPVLKMVEHLGTVSRTTWTPLTLRTVDFTPDSDIVAYALTSVSDSSQRFEAFSDALDKPFTTVERSSGTDTANA